MGLWLFPKMLLAAETSPRTLELFASAATLCHFPFLYLHIGLTLHLFSTSFPRFPLPDHRTFLMASIYKLSHTMDMIAGASGQAVLFSRSFAMYV